MAAYGLYTHIASNKTRSILLLFGLFLLIYVIVFAGAIFLEVFLHQDRSVDYYLRASFADVKVAFPYATGAAILWIIVAYFFNVSIIDAVTGASDVTRKEQPRLYNLLENLCISRGIPMPKLKVMDTEALNAFASGLNPRQYSVTVTSGLLKNLNDEEMEAVLGHELTHIRNGDVQLMVIAVIIAGVVGFAAEVFFRIFFNSNSSWSFGGGSSSRSSSSSSDSDRKGGGGGALVAILIAVALIVVAWFLSLVVRFALSRSREFLADAGSVELTKNPDAMISALRKIENRGELEGATSAVMEMCIDNPREGFTDLFATHPSVDARIRALVKFAGGHDQGRIARPEDTETDLSDEAEDETAPAGADAPQGELPPTQPGIPPQAPAPQPQPRPSPWGALKPAIPFGRRNR